MFVLRTTTVGDPNGMNRVRSGTRATNIGVHAQGPAGPEQIGRAAAGLSAPGCIA